MYKKMSDFPRNSITLAEAHVHVLIAYEEVTLRLGQERHTCCLHIPQALGAYHSQSA